MTANEKQIGGSHYKRHGDLQPWDVVLKWNLGYLEGTALKYIARWRDKGGIADIQKAIHFLEKLVEQESPVKENHGNIHYQQSQLPSYSSGSAVVGTLSGQAYQGKDWVADLAFYHWPSGVFGPKPVQLHPVRSGTDSTWQRHDADANELASNSSNAIPHWGLTQEGDRHT